MSILQWGRVAGLLDDLLSGDLCRSETFFVDDARAQLQCEAQIWIHTGGVLFKLLLNVGHVRVHAVEQGRQHDRWTELTHKDEHISG